MEVFSFIFGAVIGSFLNVVILRAPLNKSVVSPRSYCPSCKTPIAWYNNIPLLSYILLRAKCSSCKVKIPFQYFLVELICACLSLVLFVQLALSLEFLFALIFFYILVVLAFIDLKYKAVPDYLLLLAFIFSFTVSDFSFLDSLKNAFLFAGALVLLNFIITFYIQNIKARILKDESLKTQEALGEGDLPIIASIGVILGVEAGLIAIFLAALFAIIPSIYSKIVKKDNETPFIPYLLLGLGVQYFFSLDNYLRFVS